MQVLPFFSGVYSLFASSGLLLAGEIVIIIIHPARETIVIINIIVENYFSVGKRQHDENHKIDDDFAKMSIHSMKRFKSKVKQLALQYGRA